MKREYKKLFLFVALWQVVILLFFSLGLRFLPIQDNFLGGSIHFKEAPLLWSHANYDGEHYIEVAQFGYGPYTYFFFPLYPVLLRFVSHYLVFLHFPLVWSGIVISNSAFFIAVVVLYKLLRLDYSENVSFRTVLLLLLFPTSFYFTMVYTESLFFALCVSSLYFARKRNWMGAGILGIFASMTRLVGVVLIASIFFEWLSSYLDKKSTKIALLPILCVPLGIAFYMFYLNKVSGDPLAFFHNIAVYGQQRSTSLVILPQVYYRYIFKILPHLNGYVPIILTTYFELISGVIFFVLSAVSFFKVRPSYSVFAFFCFIIPTLSGSFSSLPRYVLILFPLFLVLSLSLEKLPRTYHYVYYALGAVFLLVFTSMFAVGYWVS